MSYTPSPRNDMILNELKVKKRQGKQIVKTMPKSKSNHKRLTNHKGSAGEFKVSGAICLFRRSIAFHNLVYPSNIGNGIQKQARVLWKPHPLINSKQESLSVLVMCKSN